MHQVTPSTLTWLYKTFAYKPAATDQNEFGIAGFLPEYPNQTDLTRFMKEFCTNTDDATFKVVWVNGGGYNPKDPEIEGNLNIQYASALTYPTPQTWWSVGGQTQIYDDTGEPAPGDVFLEWFDFLLGQPKIPQTRSARPTVWTRKIACWNMRRFCASCSHSSGHVASASSTLVGTMVSVLETARAHPDRDRGADAKSQRLM